MEVSIRDARVDDVAGLAALFRRSSLSNSGDVPQLLAHPAALRLDPSILRSCRVRVASTPPGGPVGFASTSEREAVLELVDLFVEPAWMRRGVGSALIADVVAFARSRGIASVEVTGNPHALVFYQHLGFIITGEVATEFGPGFRLQLAVTQPAH